MELEVKQRERVKIGRQRYERDSKVKIKDRDTENIYRIKREIHCSKKIVG